MSVKIIARAKGFGKTRHCINWLLEGEPDGKIIVTSDQQRRFLLIRTIAEQTNTPAAQWWSSVLTYDSVRRLRGKTRSQVYIDQADHLLQHLLGPGAELKGVTWDA